MEPNIHHYFLISTYMQDRMDAAVNGRRVAEVRRAQRQRRPLLRWSFRRYSVPKMRSPASPKPGRM
jgi:hypothetical protein